MDIRLGIFLIIASILTMAIYSSSANFVSAETKCYISGEKRVCITTATTVDHPLPTQSNRDILSPARALVLCDKDGTNCTVHWLDKVSVVTPEVKNAIKNAQIQLDSAIKSQNGGLITGQNNTQGSNLSQSTINNSPKVSSQSPQTSQSRQAPNTSFGN